MCVCVCGRKRKKLQLKERKQVYREEKKQEKKTNVTRKELGQRKTSYSKIIHQFLCAVARTQNVAHRAFITATKGVTLVSRVCWFDLFVYVGRITLKSYELILMMICRRLGIQESFKN